MTVRIDRRAVERAVQHILRTLGITELHSADRAAIFREIAHLLEGETLRCSRLALQLALKPREQNQEGLLALAERIRAGAADPAPITRPPRSHELVTAPFLPPRPPPVTHSAPGARAPARIAPSAQDPTEPGTRRAGPRPTRSTH